MSFDWFANAEQTFYFIYFISTRVGKTPFISFFFFFYCIFLPILGKLFSWLCFECVSWFWAELWLASQQISKCLGFITWRVHNAAFQYFRKPLNWMLFFKNVFIFNKQNVLVWTPFPNRQAYMNLFQGQGYFSAGLKWLFKPPWIFPLFISGFSFQWIDQGQQSHFFVLHPVYFSIQLQVCIQPFWFSSSHVFGPAKENIGHVVQQEILPHLVLVLSINMKKWA